MIPVERRAIALTDLGLLAVLGADASRFLAAQLSQRMPVPGSGQACLAAWHDPKGRVRSLCRVLAVPAVLLLIAERASVAPLAEALRRFVLRADVRLDDVSDSWQGAALLDGPALPCSDPAPASRDGAPEATALLHALFTIRAGPRLAYVFGQRAQVDAACHALPVAEHDAAVRAEIELGLPPLGFWPEPRFLGQMLNLDHLGAIAFDKGCYPGQEILTRAHRLGTVKRRLYRYAGAGSPPAVGTALLDSARTVVGEVVRAVSADAGCELLAVTQIDARDGALVCASAPDLVLRRLPLPTDTPAAGSEHRD